MNKRIKYRQQVRSCLHERFRFEYLGQLQQRTLHQVQVKTLAIADIVLLEVELYKFGGELRDWLTFWNQFKNIHENKNLTDCDKFHYLIQSTKIKSEARELVESFPITNENSPLAIESLTERYGRKELLIDFYVRELLILVLNNATKKKQDSLSSLYNKLSTQLRALSSLGVTTDQCGVILYPLVESSLPTHILRSFERQRKNIDSEQSISTLDAIVSFLKSEVQSEEKIKLSRSEKLPYERECKHLAKSQNTLPAAAELFIQESKDTCAFCFKVHANRFCKRTFFIPLEEKIAIIKKKDCAMSAWLRVILLLDVDLK
ncbi:DUF1758 domain-containing protein [Nephila pilipes]|uniref:DUF1758 domain-containing protein n=1 Tax=Nephila pilipes TaxID=299642 RepID=A0A8X6I3C5_NEPPI|nr:DUF1758 domain-containing protein [Nephila pilipes]